MLQPLSLPLISDPVVETDRSLDFLIQLVRINSPTGDKEGVNKVQRLVAGRLKEMGLQTRLIPHAEGKYGDLLFAERQLSPLAKTITLVCHADTVFDFPEKRINCYAKGDRLDGPGVADNKGGIVVALETIKKILRYSLPVNLRLVCSPNEEIGSHGFTDFFRQIGKESDLVLGFEPSAADGSIIDSRCGNRWYHIEVQGISAHAGRASGEEINAAHELIAKINHLLELKKEYSDLKINIAQLGGGSERYNIVCDRASVKIDIRYSQARTRDAFHAKLTQLTAHSFYRSNAGRFSHARWRLDDDCPPLEKNEKSRIYSQLFKSCIEEIESRPIDIRQVGGAADLNYFSQPDNAAIDGLGPVGGGMHTAHEYILIDSLASRSAAVAKAIGRLLS